MDVVELLAAGLADVVKNPLAMVQPGLQLIDRRITDEDECAKGVLDRFSNACHLAQRRSVSRLPVIALIVGCVTSLPLRPLRSPLPIAVFGLKMMRDARERSNRMVGEMLDKANLMTKG